LGGARSFQQPTMSAMLPSIVPASVLQRAVAASSSFMQTATIIGPSLGGVLYAVSPALSLGLCAAFLLVGAVCVVLIQGHRFVPSKAPVTLKSVFGGVSFIRRRPIILGTISLDLFAVLLGGVTALLPIFASDILKTGPWGLGMLRSAPALGALSMSLVLAHISLDKGAGYKMFAAVLVFGLATIVFSLSTSLPLSLFCLFMLGAADNVSVVVRSSLVQLQTPDDMRGRVNAVNFLFIGASNQLGEFESGMMAGLLGAVPSGVIGGIGTIVVALLWMRLFPELRRVQSLSG
jgi:MFS family permease